MNSVHFYFASELYVNKSGTFPSIRCSIHNFIFQTARTKIYFPSGWISLCITKTTYSFNTFIALENLNTKTHNTVMYIKPVYNISRECDVCQMHLIAFQCSGEMSIKLCQTQCTAHHWQLYYVQFLFYVRVHDVQCAQWSLFAHLVLCQQYYCSCKLWSIVLLHKFFSHFLWK